MPATAIAAARSSDLSKVFVLILFIILIMNIRYVIDNMPSGH
jgi:hypothetical protein